MSSTELWFWFLWELVVSISWKDYFLISDYVVSVCGEKALCAVFASFHLEGTICGWWEIKGSAKFCTILLILSSVFTLYVMCLQAMLAASASRKSAKKKKKKAGKVLAENAEAGDGSDWMERGLPSNIFQPVLPWPGKTVCDTQKCVRQGVMVVKSGSRGCGALFMFVPESLAPGKNVIQARRLWCWHGSG